ncbi:hypothetical protein M3Y99_01461600 [Aphelenchoides fujianensis]|nr:hypothetical protein M3Y99_01461600 [Aphelenchoides fujianensis]
MSNNAQSTSAADPQLRLRLGRPLDYAQLRAAVRADPRFADARYAVDSPFVSERVDLSRPVDRVCWEGQWFVSGCVVSRRTADGRRVFAQIVRLYRNPSDFCSASLVDLRPRAEFRAEEAAGERPFDPRRYEATEPAELLVPLARLTFVRPTPTGGPFFAPQRMLGEEAADELRVLRRLREIVDEERDFQWRATAPNGVNPQQFP